MESPVRPHLRLSSPSTDILSIPARVERAAPVRSLRHRGRVRPAEAGGCAGAARPAPRCLAKFLDLMAVELSNLPSPLSPTQPSCRFMRAAETNGGRARREPVGFRRWLQLAAAHALRSPPRCATRFPWSWPTVSSAVATPGGLPTTCCRGLSQAQVSGAGADPRRGRWRAPTEQERAHACARPVHIRSPNGERVQPMAGGRAGPADCRTCALLGAT